MHELKIKIIQEVLQLQDPKALEALMDIVIDLKTPEPYPLSPKQIKAIQEAEIEIENGQTTPHQEVMENAKRWLHSQ